MEITLTSAQWREMKGIVNQGANAEQVLGIPFEITKGTTKIEISATEINIELTD